MAQRVRAAEERAAEEAAPGLGEADAEHPRQHGCEQRDVRVRDDVSKDLQLDVDEQLGLPPPRGLVDPRLQLVPK